MAVWYTRDNSTVATDTLSIVTGSVGWSAMTAWSASATIAAGALGRQSAGTAQFTASSSTTTLTVTAVASGTIYLGMHTQVGGTNNVITAFGSGSGGTGTYTLQSSQTQGSTTWNGGLTAGNERAFVAIVGGTTGATEPNWTLTKGAKTTDNTVTWQECTGQPAVNGDLTNTPLSSSVRSTNPGLGKIITDNAGTHIFICSTAGTCGAGEPTYNTAAVGNTTTDSGATWTYLGTSFSNWAAPHARVHNVFGTNWAAAGDVIYFGDDHAEIQAAQNNINPVGTSASPNFLYSIDHTLSLPVSGSGLKTGATISTQGASNNLATGNTGSSYWYGFTFSAGNSSNFASVLIALTSQSLWIKLDSCLLKLNNTSSSSSIFLGGVGPFVELVNTTMQFGAAGQSVVCEGNRVIWRNTASAIAGTAPTTLYTSTQNTGLIVHEGIDLSAIGSGGTLVGTGAISATFLFIDCKLGASVTIAGTPTSLAGPVTDAIRCSSSATNYVQRRYWYQGTLQEETTIVRTGGATDGTTPISWNITTTANSKWLAPFESFPISIWNSRTSASLTVTVYGIWGGGAVPNNDDIWFVVEYLGSTGAPLASFATTTKSNNLATGTALASDTSTWGGSTTKFKMAVTFTPQLTGYLRVYVKAAKASSTFYIDPLPVLS